MKSPDSSGGLSFSRHLLRKLTGIQAALEGIDRSLERVALALNPPRERANDQCPADVQPHHPTPAVNGVPAQRESSAA